MILGSTARVCAIALSIGAAPVAKASVLSLLVAAGGGGGAITFFAPAGPGLITESGGDALGPNSGAGGTAGSGGGAATLLMLEAAAEPAGSAQAEAPRTAEAAARALRLSRAEQRAPESTE
jgi:hypothetical protein